jgi:hypothetical protein
MVRELVRALLPLLAIASVSTRCAGPVAPTPPGPPALEDAIEALFLGSGPLAAGDCLIPGMWMSYPRGATVALVLASTIDGTGQATLERAVADAQDAIAGRFRLVIERTAEVDPVPAMLQITSADVSAERVRSTCSPGGSGCVRVLARQGPLLDRVQAIQLLGSSQRLKVHEFGHAMGLCHILGDRVPEAAMADPPGVTATGRFSEIERQALRAVYESSLEPGATRADFQRAGLVR